MSTTIDRVRAVLRLLSPDHITPVGRRMIEKVLDDEERAENPFVERQWSREEVDQWMRDAGIPPVEP
jgi:hypothetical protein